MEHRRPQIVDLTIGSSSSSSRPASSPNYVQVLSDSPPPREEHSISQESTSNRHGIKRRRLNDDDLFQASPSSSSFSSRATGPSQPRRLEDIDLSNVESVDLTDVNDSSSLAKALAKQREDAIKAQASTEDREGRSILTSYKCPVCMDTPTDATSTVCGHLFCHKCIIDTLKFSEEQRADSSGKTPRGNCPVCRKTLSRNDIPGQRGRNLVPLQLKLTRRKVA